jgi:hypothetical protein
VQPAPEVTESPSPTTRQVLFDASAEDAGGGEPAGCVEADVGFELIHPTVMLPVADRNGCRRASAPTSARPPTSRTQSMAAGLLGGP